MKTNMKTNMKNKAVNKINSVSAALDAVSNRYYIIGSINEYGELSFASNPVVHNTEWSAKTEVTRLAQANPGKHFVYVRFYGGAIATGISYL